MKKLIIICLLALTYNISYAQEPTKQETMDWIAGKFEKYLIKEVSKTGIKYYYKYSFNKYQEGVIYINSNQIKTDNDVSIFDEVEKIDLNAITSIKVEKTEIGENLFLQGNAIYYRNEEWVPSFLLTSIDDGRYIRLLINFNNEPNLFERMKKAFQTLAKINNANKPNEKF